MLGKLMKHEFKATSKSFLILYAAIIAIAAMDKIFLYVNSDAAVIEILQALFTLTYALGVLAIFVMTVVIIIKRFYDNMLKDQGYLSFTLPVTTNAHILSKLIVSFVWSVLTIVTMLITIVIMCLGEVKFEDFVSEVNKISYLASEYELWGTIIKCIPFLIIGMVFMILAFYFCMAVGQLFNKHKILGAVGVYFGIYIVMQIIGTFIIATISVNVYNNAIMTSAAEQAQYNCTYIDLLMNSYIIVYLVLIAVFYVGTVLLLDKKLNLE